MKDFYGQSEARTRKLYYEEVDCLWQGHFPLGEGRGPSVTR